MSRTPARGHASCECIVLSEAHHIIKLIKRDKLKHTNATQTSRAVSLFYALTGQFDRRGSNVLFASTATNALAGRELLPKAQASRTLGVAERPLGPPGTHGQVTA